jgi:hypothetical protein
MTRQRFSKGDQVEFRVRRGQHNILAGRPGEVTARKGRYIVVRCTEAGTIFCGQEYLTPPANLRKTS